MCTDFLTEFVLQEARGELVILRFLIKAVGYVFGLIMRVWRGAVQLGAARLGAGRKETLPSQSFSLETLPGPHQRSPSFSATFLPPVSFHNVPFSQRAAPCSSRTCLTNTAAKQPCPHPASIHPVLLRHRRKITATFFRCEVHSFIFVNRDEVCQ